MGAVLDSLIMVGVKVGQGGGMEWPFAFLLIASISLLQVGKEGDPEEIWEIQSKGIPSLWA